MKFVVKGISTVTGKRITLTVAANDEESAAQKAKASGMYPYEVRRPWRDPDHRNEYGHERRARKDQERRHRKLTREGRPPLLVRFLESAGLTSLLVILAILAGIGFWAWQSDLLPGAAPLPASLSVQIDEAAIERQARNPAFQKALTRLQEKGIPATERELAEGYVFIMSRAFIQPAIFFDAYAQAREQGMSHVESVYQVKDRYAQ